MISVQGIGASVVLANRQNHNPLKSLNPFSVRLVDDALGPTLFAWPGRDGTILPIAKHFADDLLATGLQPTLLGRPEAAFGTRRTYLNSPRTAHLLRPGVPILFYETKRSGGRSSIVAVARVVDVTIVGKAQVTLDMRRRSVVDDIVTLSATSDVLATTFDNVMRLPRPVTLQELRALRATGSNNLQVATVVSADNFTSIIDRGRHRA